MSILNSNAKVYGAEQLKASTKVERNVYLMKNWD